MNEDFRDRTQHSAPKGTHPLLLRALSVPHHRHEALVPPRMGRYSTRAVKPHCRPPGPPAHQATCHNQAAAEDVSTVRRRERLGPAKFSLPVCDREGRHSGSPSGCCPDETKSQERRSATVQVPRTS